jgi:hypothetical protein
MSADDQASWVIIDISEPVNPGEDFPTLEIDSRHGLDEALGRMREGEPRTVYLERGSLSLLLGISERWGFAQCYEDGSPHRELFAKPREERPESVVTFPEEGLQEPYRPDNVLPVEEVFAIAAAYFETSQLPPEVEWGDRVRA